MNTEEFSNEQRLVAAVERIAAAFEVIAACLVADSESEGEQRTVPEASKVPRTFAGG